MLTYCVEKNLGQVTKFSEYLISIDEHIMNLIGDEENKRAHAEKLHSMLKSTYADQGGLHGSGFNSPEDMVKNIPMWKIHKTNGEVHAAAFYKDGPHGRKMVAITSAPTPAGKKAATDIVKSDLTTRRAHAEISGKLLSVMKKTINIKDHVHSFEDAKQYHKKRGDEISKPKEDDPEVLRHPELKDHMYVRKIGDEYHTKVLLGTLGKKIIS